MSSILDAEFVVTDVETTGSNFDQNRIIEIACVYVRHGEITGKFSSLVNPHQFIPEFISDMTGITNRMVHDAPEPEDVFPVVADIFSGNPVFTAHNVTFDYKFVKRSLEREGFSSFEPEKLCTLKLARKLLPNLRKKNVGALAKYYDVKMRNRHRALDDALATAYVLLEMLDIAAHEHNITELDELLHFQSKAGKSYFTGKSVTKRVQHLLENIPESPGVYYFHDDFNDVIFAGMAPSLRQKIRNYFYGGEIRSSNIANMLRKTYNITWEETDTELQARLLEARQIEELHPEFNSNGMNGSLPFIKITGEKIPEVMKCYEIEQDGADYFGPFSNKSVADEICDSIEDKYEVPVHTKTLLNGTINSNLPMPGNGGLENYLKQVKNVRYFLGGHGNGIIEQLTRKMEEFSAGMNFEKAAALRDNINRLKLSSNTSYAGDMATNNNLIALFPGDERNTVLDVYLISRGLLADYRSIGAKAPLSELMEKIQEVYFSTEQSRELNNSLLNEIRIINTWLSSNREVAEIIFTDGRTIFEIEDELEKKILEIVS
jgi:DNA polymerase-3 subunit epsilon